MRTHLLLIQTALPLAALLAASLAAAAPVPVDGGYTATPSTSPAYEDTGGVELTDGDAGTLVWPDAAVTAPLVGWQNIDAEATFQFTTPVNIGKITAWFADSDGSAGVGLPESVRVTTTGGFDQLFPVDNPGGGGTTVPIDFVGFNITTDNVTLYIARDTALDNPVCCGGRYEWTMLSEVEFFTPDDPTAPNLNAPLLVDLGTVPDDPNQVAGQFMISNAEGVADDLTITSMSFAGLDAANFILNSNPTTLMPGESGTVSFTFDSGGLPGSYSASIEIVSNDPDSPALVEVSVRVVVPVFPSTPYQLAVVADNPVLYWPFDESGDTDNARSLVNDDPANELVARGAATRAPSTLTGGGVDLGRAASFDALADPQSRFDAANLAPTTPLDAFVVELWFNIDDSPDRYFSETFGEAGGSNQPGVIYNFNPGEFEIFAGGRTGTPVSSNEWHHVVTAFYGAGNGVEIYIDGVSAPLTDRGGGYSQVQSFGRFAIGNTVTNPQSVTGQIDEYAIYDLGGFGSLAEQQAHAARIADHYNLAGNLAGFRVTDISILENGNLTNAELIFTSRPGRSYLIWSSTDLVNWVELEDSFPGTGDLTTYTDLRDLSAEPRFFYYVAEGAP